MTALVWYCQRCRKALRVHPKGAIDRSCWCKVPVLPAHGPTTVTW